MNCSLLRKKYCKPTTGPNPIAEIETKPRFFSPGLSIGTITRHLWSADSTIITGGIGQRSKPPSFQAPRHELVTAKRKSLIPIPWLNFGCSVA
jgi:hypothetical protein